VTLLIPFAKGTLLSQLHENATVLSEAYEPEGTLVTARLPQATLDRMISLLGAGALRQAPIAAEVRDGH